MSHPSPDASPSVPLLADTVGTADAGLVGSTWPEHPQQPAPRRRNRVVLALTAVVVVLLAAGGVLTALLIDARGAATDVAAEETAEDQSQADQLAGIETELGDVQAAISDAEADTSAAQDRIQAAQQAQSAAEAQAAAVEQAESEATAHAESNFLASMREVFPGAPDATLLTRGHDLCAHLDTLSFATVYDAYDHASEVYGYEYDQALLIATAAVVMFCPEYDY